MAKIFNVIQVGTKVTVNEVFEGVIVSICVRKDNFTYEVQQTREDGVITIWSYEWEITSSHNKRSIINQCLE